MDKIQDAIAKARASRVGAPYVAPSVGASVSTPTSRAANNFQRAAWDALPMFQPQAGRLRRNRVMTTEPGRSSMDFDVIRTRVLQQAKENGWKRIAITSPGPGCGKSTTVMNLAYSLARQADQRTIVCEMDMRRPSLAKIMGMKQPLKISEALKGNTSFEEQAVRLDDNLIISINDGPVSKASELIQSEQAKSVLNDIQARYDPTIMIFDMPPLLAGDDTMGFLAQVDCAILLAAAEQTTIKQIDTCELDIASQTNVMGVVLNKCRYMKRDDAYGYYDYSHPAE